MSVQSPKMRASHLHATIESLACLGEEQEKLVRSHCSDIIDRIDEVRTGWLPLPIAARLVQSIEDICGREASLLLAHESMERSIRGTLLGPIFDGLVRLGLGPEHGLRRVPAGWNLIYRDCGSISCESQSGSATLRLTSAPIEMRQDSYLHGIGSSLCGIVTVLGGDITEITVNTDEVDVRYELRWVPRA
jgi:hypothetical protein